MGWIERTDSGRRFQLGPRVMIGRSPLADLRLEGKWISGEHVIISWDGEGWRVRDLGSSNGTTLDGVPLTCRRDHPLATGSILALGQAEELWTLVDGGPPVAMGVGPDGQRVGALDGVLTVPDEAEALVSVYREDGRWWLDDGGAPRAVRDREPVIVGGAVWHLRLPEAREETAAHPAGRRLLDFALELGLSQDEERVEVRLLRASSRVVLEPRSHHYLMVVLARHALTQRAAGLSALEAGWIDPAELADMLKVSRQSLNVYIHRIRRQVQDAGVFDGKAILQRQAGTHFLRLAPLEMAVVPLTPSSGL